MKKFQVVQAGMVIGSVFGQSLAFGYDAVRFQSLSPEAQRVKALIEDRVDRMSEGKQLRVAYRLYRTVFRVMPKFDTLSEAEFAARIESTATGVDSDPNSDQESILTSSDFEGALPESSEFSSSGAQSPGSQSIPAVSRGEVGEAIHSVIAKVGYHQNAQGEARAFSQNEFKLRLESLAGNSSRPRILNYLLNALIGIALVLAVVGLISLLGWIGLSILLLIGFVALVVFVIEILGAIFIPHG
jgi:hypothetical protein